MNLFIKKLLAKYVIYIEIIGYGLVLLFIGGLVAVSFIKAEDELVHLNGVYEIPVSLIHFPQKQLVLDSTYDTVTVVKVGDRLMTLTEDERFISDKAIIKHLKNQIGIAREQSDSQLINTFTSLLSEMENRVYPDLRTHVVAASLSGDYFPQKKTGDIVPKNIVIGGIFDFIHSKIRVSTKMVDSQGHKKMTVDQMGIATISVPGQESIRLSVQLISFQEDRIIFQVKDLGDKEKQSMVKAFYNIQDDITFPSKISVVVGSKSWLNLILQ